MKERRNKNPLFSKKSFNEFIDLLIPDANTDQRTRCNNIYDKINKLEYFTNTAEQKMTILQILTAR